MDQEQPVTRRETMASKPIPAGDPWPVAVQSVVVRRRRGETCLEGDPPSVEHSPVQ